MQRLPGMPLLPGAQFYDVSMHEGIVEFETYQRINTFGIAIP